MGEVGGRLVPGKGTAGERGRGGEVGAERWSSAGSLETQRECESPRPTLQFTLCERRGEERRGRGSM